MRIIAGEWRGRTLISPPGDVRPTTDRVRQILFDIVGTAVTEGAILDLYSGSGAIGLEALSRGAPGAVFVESDRAARAVLETNVERLGARDRSRVCERPVLEALPALEREGLRFRWVFADPPYGIPELPQLLALLGSAGGSLLGEVGGFVLEARGSDPLPEKEGLLRRTRIRAVGGTMLCFYRRDAAAKEGEGRSL